jgi:hypothetical protein
MAQVIFAETSTLGLRTYTAERRVQARHWVEVETPHGKVRMKVSGEGAYAPEYEDCRRSRRNPASPLKQVIAEANFAYLKEFEMKYYLTTPIYYVNAAPHIGHAYTTIVADLIKRFKRMQGYDAVLTTGSDEHGVNVERAAERAGKTPKEFCDVIAAEFERNGNAGSADRSFPAHHRPETRARGARSV